MDGTLMEGNMLGTRLLSARKAAGISTRALAERLHAHGFDISHATVANYERGSTLPPLTAVAAIADIFGIPVNWFLEADSVLTGVCYRAVAKVSAKDKRQFEGLAQRWLGGYRRLEVHLGRQLRNELADFRPEREESAKRLAERLRSRLGIGDHPVSSTIDILHRFGVRVMTMDALRGIDGLAAKLDGEPVVVLNSTLPNDRVRLNALHELGHYLYEDCASTTGPRDSKREKVAFEFASHLLMPSEGIKAAFQGYSMLRLVEYKRRFGISLAAMIFRARKEKILTQRVYTMLWREFAKRGWRKAEPGEVVADRPVRFEQMLEDGVQTGTLTWPGAAGITRIRESELRDRLASALGGHGTAGTTGGEKD
jgi:Zn-dependent peptidase ImmA (M78 family)/transcriptional regulator with XRE-family HTH domain